MIHTAPIPSFGAFSRASSRAPASSGGEAFQNSMDLLQALSVRLRSAVRTGSVEASAASVYRLQQVVLECSVDLEALHRYLRTEGLRRGLQEKTCAHRQFGAPANGQARIAGARWSPTCPETSMTLAHDIAALELRIAQEEKKRDAWRAVGADEKYMEAYGMVEALELQLERKLLQTGGYKE